jgi:hypothetical protein
MEICGIDIQILSWLFRVVMVVRVVRVVRVFVNQRILFIILISSSICFLLMVTVLMPVSMMVPMITLPTNMHMPRWTISGMQNLDHYHVKKYRAYPSNNHRNWLYIMQNNNSMCCLNN